MENNVLAVISAVGGVVGGVGTIISCIVAYKVYREGNRPKLALDYEIKNSLIEDENKFNKSVWYTEEERYNKKYGFNRTGEDFNIYLEIKNIGDIPIENLKVEYEIEIFTVRLKFINGDESNFVEEGYKYYKTISKDIHIDYLSPDKQLRYYILATDVIYRCKINIRSVKYGNSLIRSKLYKKKFTLATFDVSEIISLEDSVHLKRMVGLMGENDCREAITLDLEENLD